MQIDRSQTVLDLEKKLGLFRRKYLESTEENKSLVKDALVEWIVYDLGIHTPQTLEYACNLVLGGISHTEEKVIDLYRNNMVIVARVLMNEIKEDEKTYAEKEFVDVLEKDKGEK